MPKIVTRWSKEELELLMEKFSISTKQELIKLIPNHSYGEIRSRAYHLNFKKTEEIISIQSKLKNKKWTEEQVKFFEENYPNYSNKFLAKELNKTISSIINRAVKYGLKKTKETLYHSNSDARRNFKITKQKLEEMYITKGLSCSDIAKLCNVHSTSIHIRLKEYQIPRRERKLAQREKIIKLLKNNNWLIEKAKTKESHASRGLF